MLINRYPRIPWRLPHFRRVLIGTDYSKEKGVTQCILPLHLSLFPQELKIHNQTNGAAGFNRANGGYIPPTLPDPILLFARFESTFHGIGASSKLWSD